jgi:hypothetical protein
MYDNNVENKRVKDTVHHLLGIERWITLRCSGSCLVITQYFGRTCRKINIHLIKASFPLDVLVEF